MNKGEKKAYDNAYHRAKRFVYKNARPVDLARWQYHFEDGSKEAVLEALACYQNADGGFGYGLEPDYWNPHSSPAQVYEATEILWEIGMDRSEAEHPIIQGILDYLSSGKEFDEEYWSHTVDTNNKYPHADWWHFPHSSWWEDTTVNRFAFDYNPTAGLAGFILYYEDMDTEFYYLAKRIAKRAVEAFMQINDFNDLYVVACFCRLYDYIVEAELEDEFPIDEFEKHLKEVVHNAITQDENLYITMWDVNICRPSNFINDKESLYFKDNKNIAEFEIEFIRKTQMSDGSWEVTWEWGKSYQEAWGVAKNWWKSRIAIRNLLYWSGMIE